MKITIEKSQYDHATSEFKTRVLVFETNEVELIEAFRMVEKNLDIISINGKHDWRDRLFDGLVDAIDNAAPVINPCPLPHVLLEPPKIYPWVPMQPLPLIGDPPGWPNNPTVICSGKTSDQTGVVPFLSGMTEAKSVSAMTQADGQGDDSGTRGD